MDELNKLKEENDRLLIENQRLAKELEYYKGIYKRLEGIIKQHEKAKKGLNHRDDITDEEIISLYNSGLTTAYKIAKKLKCSEPTIRKRLKQLNLFSNQVRGGKRYE